MKRCILMALVAVVLAALAFLANPRLVVFSGAADRAQTQLVAQGGATPRGIYASGRVEGATPEVELRFQLPGRVAEVLVRPGQMVKPGEVLLQLDDREYQQEIQLAAASLRLAQAERARLENGARAEERAEATSLLQAKLAELENAQLAWDRFRRLRADDAVAQHEADTKRLLVKTLQGEVAAARARAELLQAPPRDDELQMAQARIDAAAARLELANIQLDRTRLKAALCGQVLDINVEPGELTGPDAPDPAVTLAGTACTQVRAFVEELDAPHVQVGMHAQVTADGLAGRAFTGRVIRLSPHMSRKKLWTDRPEERLDTKVREIWIELDDSADLVFGLPVDVIVTAPVATPPETVH